jgi:hypothetical protein
MSVKENMIFDSNGFRFKIFKRRPNFAGIGYKLSSCLELDNWIVSFSLESDPDKILNLINVIDHTKSTLIIQGSFIKAHDNHINSFFEQQPISSKTHVNNSSIKV